MESWPWGLTQLILLLARYIEKRGEYRTGALKIAVFEPTPEYFVAE